MKNIQMALNTIQPLINMDSINNKEPSINQLIYVYYKLYYDDKKAIEYTDLYLKKWLQEYNNNF